MENIPGEIQLSLSLSVCLPPPPRPSSLGREPVVFYEKGRAKICLVEHSMVRWEGLPLVDPY